MRKATSGRSGIGRVASVVVVVAVGLVAGAVPFMLGGGGDGGGTPADPARGNGGGPEAPDARAAAVEAMMAGEMLLQDFGPGLKGLARELKDLQLPGPALAASGTFTDEVMVVDLADEAPHADGHDDPAGVFDRAGIHEVHWAVREEADMVARGDLDLWRPLLDRVEWFDHAKFYFIRYRFLDAKRTRFATDVGFSARARMKNGRWATLHGNVDILFEADPRPDGGADWRIAAFRTDELHGEEVEHTIFEDVLDAAVPDAEVRRRLRTSVHERLAAAYILDAAKPEEERTFEKPHEWFRPPSQDRHPGVTVADVDQDGWDDIYVMARWGRNILLRNNGDGTFTDTAPAMGLDLENHCASAVFADFDNDGDPDVIIGRTVAPSLYMVNDGGRFEAAPESRTGGPLPQLVSAVSCADVDGDGLLDVHFSTYASDIMRKQDANPSEVGGTAEATSALSEFLSPEDSSRLQSLVDGPDWNTYRNAYGPPNVLLRNTGAGFEPVADEAVGIFRHTYQATFADYDGDGDPDLYCANDFAPNNLLRNEGGRFTDVTDETDTADIGFGMGVSWGDYDEDGRLDLYVTNMFSKAGRRITVQVPGLDPVFQAMARGNSLLRNTGDGFEKVSGMTPDTAQVEYGGWGWGSQFLDVDNDGRLDIHALSGHYTAPEGVRSQVDL